MNKFNDNARRPFEWVEIEQPTCIRVYSSAPCLAKLGVTGQEKCYNTRATCQDPANFNGSGVTVLRFCHNEASPPDDYTYFPLLESVSIGAIKLNIGGGDSNTSGLGVRGSLSVNFSDSPATDFITDPYLDDRSFNPLTRGSFWSKWRARNPYYLHRVIRFKTGFLDKDGKIDPLTLTNRTFFITAFSGLSNDGAVTIQAKDIITLSANEKAKAPNVSTGRLSANITAVANNFTLSPIGVGNLEYPASGLVRIDKELLSFTRVNDVMTVARAQKTTLAVTHNLGDSVQLCLVYGAIVGASPHDIIYDLLVNYANVNPIYIDFAQWQAEALDFLPRLYNATITAPEGVASLITEICEQCYLVLFWDDRTSLLKLKAIRPANDEVIRTLDDNANFLEGSFNATDKSDNLITQVWVYFSQKDPTKTLIEPSNFGALEIIGDPDSESPARNGIQKIKTIFSRWIEGGNGGAAIELGQKLLDRYSAIPREANFSLDAKDRDLWLADFITVKNRNMVDFTGKPAAVPMQVISVSESVQGSIYTYSAIEYVNKTYSEPNEYLVIIAVNENDINLRSLFERYYAITPQAGDVIRFVIQSNVIIGSSFNGFYNGSWRTQNTIDKDTGNYTIGNFEKSLPILSRRDLTAERFYTSTIDNYIEPVSGVMLGLAQSDIIERPCGVSLVTGSWVAGVTIYLDIEAGGAIVGHGGAGAVQSWDNGITEPFRLLASGDGGAAMQVTYPIIINNEGIIGGGGGGGGSSGNLGFIKEFNGTSQSLCSGVSNGGGGAGSNVSNEHSLIYNTTSAPSAGSVGFYLPTTLAENPTETTGAAGATIINDYIFPIIYTMGKGGDLAEDGTLAIASIQNVEGSYIDANSGERGRGGYAIKAGNSLINWVNMGDIRGDINP